MNAITKREEDGIVVVDREICLGNVECPLFCKDACPYGAPQFGAEEGAKMQKCDLCGDRWTEGKKPICVEACPMRALDTSPVNELETKYGDIRQADSFVYSPDIKPSVIFKPKSWEVYRDGEAG